MSEQGSDIHTTKTGTAEVVRTSVDIEWQQFPEDFRDNVRREIIQEITTTFPIEMILMEAIKSRNNDFFDDGDWESIVRTSLREAADEEMRELKMGVSGLGKLQQRVSTLEDVVEETESNPMTDVVEKAVAERPQVTLSALGLVTLMAAFYFSSPLLAISGVLILIVTTLHYGH